MRSGTALFIEISVVSTSVSRKARGTMRSRYVRKSRRFARRSWTSAIIPWTRRTSTPFCSKTIATVSPVKVCPSTPASLGQTTSTSNVKS
jgi:hypothetical protein